jgi:glycosyltransferase involved in cell wall biosynthesis
LINLVFVTQLLDPEDPVLGFVIGPVRALARSADHVVVIANEVRAVPDDLGAEVVSLGKERGWGRARRGLRYQAVLARLALDRRPLTLVAHMCPRYLTVAAPIARASGMRTVLWFTHSSASRPLARAELVADAVITALPHSYPRSSNKVRAIGHSIDIDRFAYALPQTEPTRCRLLAVGRTSPVKGYPLMIRALAQVRQRGVDAELHILGPSTTPSELGHRRDLEHLVQRLGLGNVIHLVDGVPPAEVVEWIQGATAMVNAHDSTADKVVFESLACGRPVLACSADFHRLMGGTPLRLDFRSGETGELADRIVGLAEAPPETLAAVGRELRDRVVRAHSLQHWAEAIVGLARELHGIAPTAVGHQAGGPAAGSPGLPGPGR